jgi:hypothetical protein
MMTQELIWRLNLLGSETTGTTSSLLRMMLTLDHASPVDMSGMDGCELMSRNTTNLIQTS